MGEQPSSAPADQSSNPPAPEVLQPRSETPEAIEAAANPAPAATDPNAKATVDPKMQARLRRGSYRPNHKATFIGLIVVVVMLAVNALVIGFVIKKQQQNKDTTPQGQVTISQGVLDKLGVNRSSVGNEGIELTVEPDANFKGTVSVGGDTSIAGKLKLNGTFTAPAANFTQLDAGKTALTDLNVNGDATVSTLALRKDLGVAGTTRLQGTVTISQLLTVNNNVTVSGSLSIGGVLSVNTFHTTNLTVDSNVTFGGHLVTTGTAPQVGTGPAVGSNGTVSISGNDAAGTVAVNIGIGGGGGIVAVIAFRNTYSNIPRVMVTAVNAGHSGVYVTRTTSGFSIGISGAVSPGGYAFDYFVVQ